MASIPTNSLGSVVVDANVLVALCAKEKDKFTKAHDALDDYAQKGWVFYAPGVVVGEVLYVLCGKLQSGVLTTLEHERAVQSFDAQMKAILPPPSGDAALILRAEALRKSYGCSRSADSLYLALTEELTQSVRAELLTFDQDLQKQAVKNASGVKINLLPL